MIKKWLMVVMVILLTLIVKGTELQFPDLNPNYDSVAIGGGYASGGITLYGTGNNKGSGFYAKDILISGNILNVQDLNVTGNVIPALDATKVVGNASNRFLSMNASGIIQAGNFVGDGSLLTNLPSQAGSFSNYKTQNASSDTGWQQSSGVINTSSKVGIGTNAPLAALHINSSSVGGALLITNGSGSNYTAFFVNTTSGIIGIGTATPSGKSLHVYATDVATHTGVANNFLAGMAVDVLTSTGAPPSTTAVQSIDAQFLAKYNPGTSVTNNFNTFRMTGKIDSSVSDNYTGEFAAGNFIPQHNGTGTANILTGIKSNINVQNTGNVNSIRTFASYSPTFSSTGVVTNAYGMYIDSHKVTGVTTGYGIYQAGTGDYNYFGGKVGINTTSPAQTLTVQGTLNVTSPSSNLSTLFATAAGTVGIGTTLPNAGLSVGSTGSQIELFNPTRNSTSNRLLETIGANNGVAQYQMISPDTSVIIDYDPRPGPFATATVRYFRQTSTNATKAFVIDKGDGTNTQIHQLSPNSTTIWNQQLDDIDFNIRGSNETSLFYVSATNDKIGIGTSTPSERFTIVGNVSVLNLTNYLFLISNATGNVGIASSTPEEKLTVSGNASVTGQVKFSGLPATAPGDTNVCIGATPGFILRSGATCGTSLRIYKYNESTLTHGLDYVMKLKPETFNWKYNNMTATGFIADDVAKINKDLGVYTRGNLSDVNERALIAVLTKAIQEQQKEIDELKQEIIKLKSKQ